MRPLVSIITLTYNHEPFLEQCLEGVQMQEGDFELEHIVVDDASKDESPKILERYAQEAGWPVRLILRKENQGANAGMAEAYGIARGEFVATCEGDDWWLAPDKLQAQIELMRRRPDLAMCFHDAVVVDEGRMQWPQVRPGKGAPVRSLDELLQDNFVHTCTALYRRTPGLSYPEWYTRFTVGDWPNHAFHAARGGIGYISRPMAAYRVHREGSWSGLKEQERRDQICAMLEELDGHFLFRYSERIAETISRIKEEALAA